jgi:predicted nucleic acid-binding protein
MADVVVLDTNMDSRLTEPELAGWAHEWLARRNLLAITAPTILERRFGYQAHFPQWESLWEVYVELLVARTVEVLPLDFVAAEIAGHVRTVCPFPESGRRQRKGRSKAARRVSWILDILIAAIAARHGYPVFTANERDFVLLSAKVPAPYRLDVIAYPAFP